MGAQDDLSVPIFVKDTPTSYTLGGDLPINLIGQWKGLMLQMHDEMGNVVGKFKKIDDNLKFMTGCDKLMGKAGSVTHKDNSIKTSTTFIWKAPFFKAKLPGTRKIYLRTTLVSHLQPYSRYWVN